MQLYRQPELTSAGVARALSRMTITMGAWPAAANAWRRPSKPIRPRGVRGFRPDGFPLYEHPVKARRCDNRIRWYKEKPRVEALDS